MITGNLWIETLSKYLEAKEILQKAIWNISIKGSSMVLRSQNPVQLVLNRLLIFIISVILALKSENCRFEGASTENKTKISGDVIK